MENDPSMVVAVDMALDDSTYGWHPDRWDALILIMSCLGGLIFYRWASRR